MAVYEIDCFVVGSFKSQPDTEWFPVQHNMEVSQAIIGSCRGMAGNQCAQSRYKLIENDIFLEFDSFFQHSVLSLEQYLNCFGWLAMVRTPSCQY